MEIKRFTKIKNGMYLLSLDNNEKIKVHEDLILKYDLLLSRVVSDDLLEIIQNENRIYEIYDVALKYINTRLRSKRELREYLLKKEYTKESIDFVIKMLSNQGYLNDKVYANSYIHDKILMSNYGPNKIKGELEKIGISSEIVNEAISCFTEEMEQERINKIIAKQNKTNRNKGSNLLKRKIQSNLLSLGYSSNVVNLCLNKTEFDTADVYKKEYNKLYAKLSKKYSGYELEYKLKQKLYQKGFTNSDFE